MPNELGRTAAIGGDNRFARTPGFQQHYSERFVSAWHTHDIACLIKISQRSVGLKAQEPRGVCYSELPSAVFCLASHFTVSCKDKLSVRVIFQDCRYSLDKQIGPLLIDHPPGKEHCRIHRTHVITPLHIPRVNPTVVISHTHSVING